VVSANTRSGVKKRREMKEMLKMAEASQFEECPATEECNHIFESEPNNRRKRGKGKKQIEMEEQI